MLFASMLFVEKLQMMNLIHHLAFSLQPVLLRWLSVYGKGSKQILFAAWLCYFNRKRLLD